ncbi:uncharacterized protein LOC111643638 [Copidosoma floridanum]|uniref:uncharacterized protein LOC111643638 n=2 Tax=Copidosoma floridanum TaxID=29053 RepID=UPI000C6F53C8|nr:uncharacterized protein LOC111643638 [Copidosoma floridanum]
MTEPASRMTIPRLELRGALIAAKLLCSAASELGVAIEHCHARCDSQIVLHWIRSDQPANNVLVDNYVAQIQEVLPPSAWRYVPSQSNPAGLATRSADMSGLQQQPLWWRGPTWLAQDDKSWPQETLPPPTPTLSLCCAFRAPESDLLQLFSSLRAVLGLFLGVRRWVRHRLQRMPTRSVLLPLTLSEVQDAFLACVRLSQSMTFGDELALLRKRERLPKRSPLTSLAAFLDADGVLRVGGRLDHSSLSYEEKHPPILSGTSPLARLVVSWAHARALHGRYRVTSAYVSRRAWILGGPRQIKAYIRGCVICARLQARSSSQLMAPLPASRVTPSRAFGRTGVDYAGPFSVLTSKGRGIRTTKGYIAVFVCMTTKAVHLELVGDLSAANFLGALTRFTGRRGRPSELWSVNATCFRRADLELREALQGAEFNWDLVAGTLASQGVFWQFIPPGAPHFGGLWEAAVKLTKSHPCRVLGSRHLTYKEFSTVLVGIKAVLNSRPLTPLSGDPSDLKVLTPGHFLIGAPVDSIVEATPAAENLDPLTH